MSSLKEDLNVPVTLSLIGGELMLLNGVMRFMMFAEVE